MLDVMGFVSLESLSGLYGVRLVLKRARSGSLSPAEDEVAGAACDDALAEGCALAPDDAALLVLPPLLDGEDVIVGAAFVATGVASVVVVCAVGTGGICGSFE